MMVSAQVKQIKQELAAAAEAGIRAYLDTMRGANLHARILPRADAVTDVAVRVDLGQGGPHYFVVHVKEER